MAAIAAVSAVAVGGCGAANTVKQAVDPVAKAAEVTSKVPGYKMSAVVSINTPAGAVKTTMSGVMDRAAHTGAMISSESIAGHAFTMSERLSGLTVYMDASGIPGADQITHGKKWLKMDMSRAFGSMGLGSLSTSSSDPSQFVDYLRAVSDSTKKVGTDSVRGVATTRYHAIIDLRKYPNIVPASQKATAKHAISTMEAVLGAHTMAMDVWIDGSKLVRRMSFDMPECVNNQKLNMSMTMDLYDYGPQPATTLPPSSQAFDLTPLLSASMQHVKLGCSSSA
ncbi:MAG TPA: hypothetical protein VHW96_04550 [Solirubrobacteraceae bacterium]|jgi:hypothetical protein|nr:hypothetical protein [Solirubrobacteraceae bacterium]